LHRPSAARAHEHVDLENALEELAPREPMLAADRVGGGPRPPEYWPIDGLELAERLLVLGRRSPR
jgi:hypothetical protein